MSTLLETIEAIKETLANRPKPKLSEHDNLAFVTKYGHPWAKDVADSPVTKEMRKLLNTLKLYRPGLGFYALRHTFETIGGGSRDQVAVNHIMGHVDSSMAATYREQIEDARLLDVTDHVHHWLFVKKSAK
jgi:integrase